MNCEIGTPGMGSAQAAYLRLHGQVRCFVICKNAFGASSWLSVIPVLSVENSAFAMQE